MLNPLAKTTAFTALTVAILSGCTENINGPEEGGVENLSVSPQNASPHILLEGSERIVITQNEEYIEPGYTASDAEDGDITASVSLANYLMDTSVPGTYQVVYQVTDSENSTGINFRIIEVVRAPEASEPIVQEPEPQTPETPTVEVAVPDISGIDIMAYTDGGESLKVQQLTSGMFIDLSTMPTPNVNMVAISENQSNTGSVHFLLSGPIEINRWENNPAYTMAVEGQNLQLSDNDLPPGNYSLTVTPYEAPDMKGLQGTSLQVNFKVVAGLSDPATENQPSIEAMDLVAAPAEGDLVTISRLVNGSVIDLNEMPSQRINFVAITGGDSLTGSVAFTLQDTANATTIIDRFENTPEYTAANDTAHIELSALPSGQYRLTASPFSEDNLTGMSGTPLVIDFSVQGYSEPSVIAADDHYTIDPNSSADTSLDSTVAANDLFDENAAVFVLLQEPQSGSITMDLTGLFTYNPAPDYSGNDSFVYEVRQGQEVSQATATVYIAPLTAPGSRNATSSSSSSGSTISGKGGFTQILPSSDSKLIYVSNSGGKDSNSCLATSAPCKTIAAGLEKMRSGYPDHVYLKRGDVWKDQTLNGVQSGKSSTEPAVVAFYGESGARPKIESSTFIFRSDKVSKLISNVNFIGLHMSAYKLDLEHPEFTGQYSSRATFTMLGGNTNLLFEDNIFDHIEVVIQAWEIGTPQNMAFRRNIWTGAYYNRSSFDNAKRPSNMYISGISGLVLEDNVIDHGGWHESVPGAGANQYNHNVYMQYSVNGNTVKVKNNIITRGSSLGLHGRGGGHFENNFFARNAVGMQMGYQDHPLKAGIKATAIYNVISEGISQFKGIDSCSRTGICTRALWGMNIEELGQGVVAVKHNIAIDGIMPGARSDLYEAGFLANKTDDSNVDYEGNISWNWGSGNFRTTESFPDPNRNLAKYYKSLGGQESFDAFMEVVLNRELQQWDDKYTASAINNYIRAGFGK